MSQAVPDLDFVSKFCKDMDYQCLLKMALSSKRLDNSTAEALRVKFGLDHLEKTRRKWLLRSPYLSVWSFVLELQEKGLGYAAIAKRLELLTGLPYTERLIGRYAKEDFFKSLYEGSNSTVSIALSSDLSRAASAVDTINSPVDQDEEERREFSAVSATTMELQEQALRLSSIDFTHITGGSIPLEDEGGIALPDGDAMQLDVDSAVSDMGLEYGQTYQPRLLTPSLDPMPGRGPYFTNYQYPEYIQPQDTMYPGFYNQDIPYRHVFNDQDISFDQVQTMDAGGNNNNNNNNNYSFDGPSANGQYDGQDTREDTLWGSNVEQHDLYGSGGLKHDGDIGEGLRNIDPQLW
ncbi:hypothetical protein G6011_02652 [Alternaria panax]|uniref:Uncharacterized protein n=1 Tax=Alternaria panax TaxID=48097 RepID=A0AAD4FAL3_9PLEO|nr:hypothetical protein G6011_02652 [Alternaria panax]